MNRKTYAFALLAVAAALVIAGCGGNDSGGAYGSKGGSGGSSDTAGSGGTGGAYAAPAPNPEEGATFVSLGNVPELGLVLVDSKGFTLYDFHKDKGTKSACYGACAQAWPPLLTSDGEPHPSNGASAAKLGTTERDDGTMQVTYAGHPLYTYAGDKKPGEATGHDFSSFGAQWYALTGNGEESED
ncbi:MAG: hypothetical protein WD810_05525 [Solirubrobacterales bacterium]